MLGGIPMVYGQDDKALISEQAASGNASDGGKKTWSAPSLRRLDGRSAEAGKVGASDGTGGTTNPS
jgi:hypothetical protein